MTIQAWDYREEYKVLREEILAAVDGVFSAGQLVLGPNVKAFEKEFAAYCDVMHGVGVNSGTDALVIALKALGIKNGDEVITVPNTAVPTVSAIVAAGGVPVFVDVDEETALMNVSAPPDVLSPRTRFVIPVHLYGQCVDMDAVLAFSKRHGLAVIEDCAQSLGATYKGRQAGSMGDMAVFSFYPTKNLGAYGDGGMITTNNAALAERATRLRMYGMAGEYRAIEHGYNSRLDEIQAAILRVKMKYLGGWLSKRRQLAAQYQDHLASSGLKLPMVAPNNQHTYHLYVARHKNRTMVLDELKGRGLKLGINYPHPIHLMPAYAELGYQEGDFPVSENLAAEVFSLPIYPTIQDGDFIQIVEMLQQVCLNK